MMPNSTTRLVEAISKVIAEMKLAPLTNRERARATAAYEHDDEAAPKPVATARVLGRPSPRRRTMLCRLTTACTTDARMNPRMRPKGSPKSSTLPPPGRGPVRVGPSSRLPTGHGPSLTPS